MRSPVPFSLYRQGNINLQIHSWGLLGVTSLASLASLGEMTFASLASLSVLLLEGGALLSGVSELVTPDS